MTAFVKYSPVPSVGGNGANRSTIRARMNAALVMRAAGYRRKDKVVRRMKKAPRATIYRTFYRAKQARQSGSKRSAFFIPDCHITRVLTLVGK